MAVVRSADIMAAAVAILTANGGAATDAGPRVWAPRDWPSTVSMYPCIFVSVPHESKQTAVGRGLPPEFFATPVLRFSLRVSDGALPDDASAGPLLHDLDVLTAQIEAAVVNNPAIWALEVQQFTSIEIQTVFDASTARQLGQRLVDISVEYHAEPESFWQPTPVPFNRVTAAFDMPVGTTEPGIDITLNGG